MHINKFMITSCLFLSLAATPAAAAEIKHDHGGAIFQMFLLETSAGFNSDGKDLQGFDFDGWTGTDEDKLWLKSEIERTDGKLETSEIWGLYSRNIGEFWDAQAGIRYDSKPKSTGYLTLGFNGLAPYWFETEAHIFVSNNGDITARLRQENDFLITQKLILQPYLEVNLSAQKVASQDIASGITDGKIGLQTRYEYSKKFAPYFDVHYGQKFGGTSAIANRNGEKGEESAASFGLRIMF